MSISDRTFGQSLRAAGEHVVLGPFRVHAGAHQQHDLSERDEGNAQQRQGRGATTSRGGNLHPVQQVDGVRPEPRQPKPHPHREEHQRERKTFDQRQLVPAAMRAQGEARHQRCRQAKGDQPPYVPGGQRARLADDRLAPQLQAVGRQAHGRTRIQQRLPEPADEEEHKERWKDCG